MPANELNDRPAAPESKQLPNITYSWQIRGPEPDSDPSLSYDPDDEQFKSHFTIGSVNSPTYDYISEHGRKHHARQDGSLYALPTDERELSRLDLQHHIFILAFKGLHLAPLPERVSRAYDIGAGSGIWSIDFAKQHPEAQVTGIDLSPITPQNVPSNCRFEIGDAELRWSAEPGSLDYVHGRMIVVGIRDWPKVLRNAYQALKPGGWIEIQDMAIDGRADDVELAPDSPIVRFNRGMIEGAAKMGIDFGAADKLPQLMQEAGFEDVHAEWQAWPVGPWAKDEERKRVGSWYFRNVDNGLPAFMTYFFSKGLGWEKEKVDELMASIREQIRDWRGNHIYFPFGSVYARKPEK